MSTATPAATQERRCGNCGTPVRHDAVTCPSCDALLAAYEAPAGSATTSDVASTTVFEPIAMQEPPPATFGQAPSPVQPVSPVTPPQPVPFDAQAALEEARRALGMSPTGESSTPAAPAVTEPQPAPPETAAAAPVQQPLRPQPRQRPAAALETPSAPVTRVKPSAQPVVERIHAAPEKPGPAGEPAEARAIREERREVPRERERTQHQDPPGPVTSPESPVITPTQLVRWGIILMVVLLILGRTPLGFTPFLVILIAGVVIANVMKKSASAGGRKSTMMQKLDDRDRRTPR